MKKQMSTDSYWLRSGIYSLLNGMSGLVLGFGGFLMLIRLLSKTDFGIWALFITVTAIIEVARNGFIQNAQVKFLAGAKEEDSPSIITASFVLNAALTLCSMLFLLVCAPLFAKLWHAAELIGMFVLYTVTTFFLTGFSQFSFVMQAKGDFRSIFFSNSLRQGIFFCAVLFSFMNHAVLHLYDLALWQLIAAVLATIGSYFLVRKQFRLHFPVDGARLKQLFHYGKFVFGTNISSMLYASVDQMLLGALMTSADVAVYNAANRMTNIIDVPVNAVASIVFPKSAARSEAQGDTAIIYLFERAVGLLLAMILPIVLLSIIFSKVIILLLAGTDYSSAVPVLQVLMAATLLQPFNRQFGVAMDSSGRPRLNFYLLLGVMLYNCLAIWLGIELFRTSSPALGAALGAASAILLFAISAFMIMKRIYRVKLRHVGTYCLQFYRDGVAMLLPAFILRGSDDRK
jgi:O-antigen/teichoic acid export membrane protein